MQRRVRATLGTSARSRGCNQVLGAVHAMSVGDRVREFCLNIPEVVAEFDRIADAKSKPTVAECV